MIFFGFRINGVAQLTFLLVLALFLPLASNADQAKLLITGKDAMKMRLQMIKNAKKEILAEYFEVGDDEMTLSGLAALRDAARHGVKVKILVDAINNRLSPQQMTVLMEGSRDAKNQQNLEIREFNPLSIENFLLPSSLLKLSYRTHDKIFMVDEDQFILGSRNVSDTYFGISSQRNFLDLDIAIKTSRESQKVRDYFYSVWNRISDVKTPRLNGYDRQSMERKCSSRENTYLCEEEVAQMKQELKEISSHLDYLAKRSRRYGIQQKADDIWNEGSVFVPKSVFLSNGVGGGVNATRHPLSDLLEKMVRSKLLSNSTQGRSIVIVTPYLFPSEKGMSLLHELCSGGIKVKIITNSLASTDNYFAQAGYRQIDRSLISMGVELYEYQGPEILHAKLALINDQHLLIGSYNFDRRSAAVNREVGLSIESSEDNQLAREVLQFVESVESRSLLVGRGGLPMNQDIKDLGVSEKVWNELNSPLIRFMMPFIEDHI